LDNEIDQLMKTAEEAAANALSKLNLTGFGASSENDGQMSNIKGPSQETQTLEQASPAKIDDKSILDVIDDDDEMKASADSGEFDKQKDT
jgi:hypothetical protein